MITPLHPYSGKLRLLIGGDLGIPRFCLKLLVRTELDADVAATPDLHDTASSALTLRPDIVLVVIHEIESQHYRLIEKLHSTGAKIIVLAVPCDGVQIRAVLVAGASAYVAMASQPAVLLDAIHAVAMGHTYLDPAVQDVLLECLLQGSRKSGPRGVHCELSSREIEVLRSIALGLTYGDIAATLHVSTKTVDTYRSRITQKLNLKSRAELVRYALLTGLLDQIA